MPVIDAAFINKQSVVKINKKSLISDLAQGYLVFHRSTLGVKLSTKIIAWFEDFEREFPNGAR